MYFHNIIVEPGSHDWCCTGELRHGRNNQQTSIVYR